MNAIGLTNLHYLLPVAVSPEGCWVALLRPLLAGPIFMARSERLLAVVEGRD